MRGRRIRRAREAAEASLKAEAAIPLTVVSDAIDLGLGGKPILVGLTETEILWVLMQMPDVVMRQRFAQVTDVSQEGPIIKLTESDPEYGRSLADPSNPKGETDFFLRLGESDDAYALSHQLNSSLFKLSPVFERRRAQISELKRRQGVAVSEWKNCPYCRNVLSSTVIGAVSCTNCGLCFCDPDLEPSVSFETGTYGHVVGTKPWSPPLETMLSGRGKTMPWTYRPPDAPSFAPPVLPLLDDIELMAKL